MNGGPCLGSTSPGSASHNHYQKFIIYNFLQLNIRISRPYPVQQERINISDTKIEIKTDKPSGAYSDDERNKCSEMQKALSELA